MDLLLLKAHHNAVWPSKVKPGQFPPFKDPLIDSGESSNYWEVKVSSMYLTSAGDVNLGLKGGLIYFK